MNSSWSRREVLRLLLSGDVHSKTRVQSFIATAPANLVHIADLMLIDWTPEHKTPGETYADSTPLCRLVTGLLM